MPKSIKNVMTFSDGFLYDFLLFLEGFGRHYNSKIDAKINEK